MINKGLLRKIYYVVCSTCKEAEPPEGRYLCLGCQAAYLRRYRATIKPVAERQALKDGQEMMRAAVISAFANLGDRHFNGWTAQAIVKELTIG